MLHHESILKLKINQRTHLEQKYTQNHSYLLIKPHPECLKHY